ncbi:hypothetical protein Ciccas_013706, partial [Cichlidogyrus casuarinus]
AKIVEKERRGEDYMSFAKDWNIKKSTVYSILKAGRKEKISTRGPREHRRKFTHENLEAAIAHIENHPAGSLQQICEIICPHVHPSTLNPHLDGAMITYKLLRHEPCARNSPENIALRQVFAQFYQHETRLKVLIDEFNFNLFCVKKFGRSRVADRASIPVRTSQGVNLNVIVAINDNGQLLKWASHVGSLRDHFATFMGELSNLLAETEAVFILDNAPIHCRTENFAG